MIQSTPKIHSAAFINQCDKSWSQTGDGVVLRNRYVWALIKACIELHVGVNIAHAVCLIVSTQRWMEILPRWKAPASLYDCQVVVNQWESDWGKGEVERENYSESQTPVLFGTSVLIFQVHTLKAKVIPQIFSKKKKNPQKPKKNPPGYHTHIH